MLSLAGARPLLVREVAGEARGARAPARHGPTLSGPGYDWQGGPGPDNPSYARETRARPARR